MLQLPGSIYGQDLIKTKGYNGALLHLTQPNSRIPVFDEDDDVFYIIETDANNNKTSVNRYRFYPEPIEDVNDKKYASKEDFNLLKEMLENVQQSVRELSEATVSNGTASGKQYTKQHNNSTDRTK